MLISLTKIGSDKDDNGKITTFKVDVKINVRNILFIQAKHSGSSIAIKGLSSNFLVEESPDEIEELIYKVESEAAYVRAEAVTDAIVQHPDISRALRLILNPPPIVGADFKSDDATIMQNIMPVKEGK